MASAEYGIYTVGDDNFFAGVVAAINALKYYGYQGPVAVIDIGLDAWMVEYLRSYQSVTVLDIKPVRKDIKFTDILSTESPVMKGWAYKAFGIVHYNLYTKWTFIDGDYLPLCNLEMELKPLIEEGLFVSTEDGQNDWGERHKDAIGVTPGRYLNINAGFISLNMDVYGHIIHEWRNLMTRYKPFDLWWGDQGALNAILDKHAIKKSCLDKVVWNQTGINEKMALESACALKKDGDQVYAFHKSLKSRIMGWHGMGKNKLWHQIGIDHYRKNNSEERAKFYRQCQGKSPQAIVEIFAHFLFLDSFNKKLRVNDFILQV
jgi:hypothetical protein